MSSISRKRLMKELKEFVSSSDPESLRLISSMDQLDVIQIEMKILNNPIYSPESGFVLRYKIGADYPFSPPQVMFVGDNIPVHPHIYSNGHICLNILYDGWTPVQTISSVVLSLQSMLQNNLLLQPPEDDKRHCKYGPSDPLLAKWVFHDDTV